MKTFTDIIDDIKYVYKNDRKEFWDILGGGLIVMFWFFFSMFVLIPIFG